MTLRSQLPVGRRELRRDMKQSGDRVAASGLLRLRPAMMDEFSPAKFDPDYARLSARFST
jgi:hypothetical protein